MFNFIFEFGVSLDRCRDNFIFGESFINRFIPPFLNFCFRVCFIVLSW